MEASHDHLSMARLTSDAVRYSVAASSLVDLSTAALSTSVLPWEFGCFLHNIDDGNVRTLLTNDNDDGEMGGA